MDTTNPKVGVRSAWSNDLLETMVHNVSCESLDMYVDLNAYLGVKSIA